MLNILAFKKTLFLHLPRPFWTLYIKAISCHPGCVLGESVVPINQSCGFDSGVGHLQESTNACMDEWNRLISLSLSLISQ